LFIDNTTFLYYYITGKVRLEKKSKNETISISFDIRDEADMGDETPPGDSPTEDNDEEGPVMNFGVYFEVSIKNSSGSSMIFSCIASQQLIIDGVRFVSANKDITDKELYGGPKFDQLNENLQDSLYDFLHDRNIDGNLCFFIIYYSRYKEEHENMNWLESISTFIKK
jgi:complement component 1 Q subcomponent-binding protein